MIYAIVTIAAPSGLRQGVLQALRSMVFPTRVEPGCLDCRLYEDVEEPGAFTLVEEWATEADFDHRIRSESYRQLLMTMELSAQPPVVRFQVVSNTMGMEAIHAARGC
jgi:quinol monooxygenase YgiN